MPSWPGCKRFLSFLIHDTCNLQQSWQWCVKCREREKTWELYHSSHFEKRPDWSQGQQKLIHKSYVQLTNFFQQVCFLCLRSCTKYHFTVNVCFLREETRNLKTQWPDSCRNYVYSMMSQTGGLNIICFNKLSWVYDVILTTFMLVPNTYL